MTSAIPNPIQFAFDPALGCWSLHSEDERGFQLDGAQTRLECHRDRVMMVRSREFYRRRRAGLRRPNFAGRV